MSNVTTNNNVDLSGINAYQYPYLKLITVFFNRFCIWISLDCIQGYKPELCWFRLKLHLIIIQFLNRIPFVSAGDSIGIGGLYYNVGYVPVNGHVRSFYALDAAGNKVHLRTDTVLCSAKS